MNFLKKLFSFLSCKSTVSCPANTSKNEGSGGKKTRSLDAAPCNELESEIQAEFNITYDGKKITTDGTLFPADSQIEMGLLDKGVCVEVFKGLGKKFDANKIFVYVGETSIFFLNSRPCHGLVVSLPPSKLAIVIQNLRQTCRSSKPCNLGVLITL